MVSHVLRTKLDQEAWCFCTAGIRTQSNLNIFYKILSIQKYNYCGVFVRLIKDEILDE